MSTKNKIVGLLIATVVALFALPASAATKSISLTVPASLTASASVQQVPVNINNTGNSNANSFEIDWSVSPNFVVQSCQVGTGTPVTPKAGLTGTGYKGCTFLSQVPNKTSVTVKLNVVITASCGAGSLTWNAFSWTGAPGPASQSFDIAALGTYTTPLPAATNCTLTFVTQPTDAFSGYTITGTPFSSTAANKVTVLAQQGTPQVPSPGAGVSVNSAACSITGGATSDANGNAIFATLTSTATATVEGCVLTATANGYSSATSAFPPGFRIVKRDGTLACDGGTASNNGNLDPLSNTFPPADGQTGFSLVRGFNTPGDCGPDIPYAFTLDPGTRTTILTEDSLGQNPSVEYIIVWPAVNPADDPFAGKQPCVSWGVNNPQFPATPDQYGCGGDYVPGLACLTDDLDIGGGAMPPIPPIAPFTGNSHPQYLPGQNAKVCIAQHGFSSGTGAATGSIIYWTKVIDQSDTGIRLP